MSRGTHRKPWKQQVMNIHRLINFFFAHKLSGNNSTKLEIRQVTRLINLIRHTSLKQCERNCHRHLAFLLTKPGETIFLNFHVVGSRDSSRVRVKCGDSFRQKKKKFRHQKLMICGRPRRMNFSFLR